MESRVVLAMLAWRRPRPPARGCSTTTRRGADRATAQAGRDAARRRSTPHRGAQVDRPERAARARRPDRGAAAATSRACAASSRCGEPGRDRRQAAEGPLPRHRHAPAQARAGARQRRHAEKPPADGPGRAPRPSSRPTRRRSTSSSSATTRSRSRRAGLPRHLPAEPARAVGAVLDRHRALRAARLQERDRRAAASCSPPGRTARRRPTRCSRSPARRKPWATGRGAQKTLEDAARSTRAPRRRAARSSGCSSAGRAHSARRPPAAR